MAQPASAFRGIARALLVVAHPDDETMFFSPTLFHLLDRACRVHVLCLSIGNHDGLGKLRKKEFAQACTLLGVKQQDMSLLDHPKLQDGPGNDWPPELVASIIAHKAVDCQCDMIVTFDAQGVSQHPNHIAVWKGAMTALHNSTGANCLPPHVQAFTLQSTSLLRKFCGPCDILLSLLQTLLGKTQCCISPRPQQAIRALKAHHSQYVWWELSLLRKLRPNISSVSWTAKQSMQVCCTRL